MNDAKNVIKNCLLWVFWGFAILGISWVVNPDARVLWHGFDLKGKALFLELMVVGLVMGCIMFWLVSFLLRRLKLCWLKKKGNCFTQEMAGTILGYEVLGSERYDGKHDWDGCICKRCGTTGNHDWDGCKCKRCGVTGNHDWDGYNGCICKRCGEENHDWTLSDSRTEVTGGGSMYGYIDVETGITVSTYKCGKCGRYKTETTEYSS